MKLEIDTAVTAATAGWNLLQLAIKARDQSKIEAAMMDMSDRLLSVYSHALSLGAQCQALQLQTNQLHQEALDREHYVLQAVAPGKFALFSQASADGLTPQHHICQACFSMGKKVVLQRHKAIQGDRLLCPIDTGHSLDV